ncbi:MAG TPA: pantetheine-phosphate adenylyltransferase [candidate division WOR-3 bacterium]|uniref:Phosphopantetheine adenylyltransferase n=1 Tax=candidate division WOR-3 bacterium TaxID=2052148 RepID=A0A7C0VCP5_UNCW3|nr:pantetheine-phosphate adenylyltransferase [candidate division WOR-3 bacterium]
MKVAVYPGTFDPVTNGHIDIIKRASRIFDKLIVLVALHRGKETMFTKEERVEMLKKSVEEMRNVEVDFYEGLIAEYVKDKRILAVIRGMRAVSDFEYEFQMALMNRHLNPKIEIIYLFPDEKYTYLSSSIVKEVASFGGDISTFVPPHVEKMLIKKLREESE